MTTQRFFDNPDFLAYARLLHQLHQLIRAGADETAKGEELRERMDEPARDLSQVEIDCLNGISADLYTLSDPPWQVQPSPPAVREELKDALEARDARDYIKALDLLRKNQVYRDAATMSYMRGRIWSEAGENEIAVDFFRGAKELAPENGNYSFMWLDALWQGKADEALTIAKAILQQTTDHPPQFVLKAADVVFASTRRLPSEEEKAVVRELIPVFEDVVIRLRTSGEGWSNHSLLASAIGLLGFCHVRLGDAAEAIKNLDKGLHLFPNNDILLTARGIQRYGTDTERSLQDFQRAAQLGSRHALAYFFLAHHYLLHDRYPEALEMASRALHLADTAMLQADCLEWIAIGQAALGYPPETVRAAFHAAQQLTPDNQRIARNLQLFEASVAEPLRPPIPWERVEPEAMRSFGSSFAPSFLNSLAA